MKKQLIIWIACASLCLSMAPQVTKFQTFIQSFSKTYDIRGLREDMFNKSLAPLRDLSDNTYGRTLKSKQSHSNSHSYHTKRFQTIHAQYFSYKDAVTTKKAFRNLLKKFPGSGTEQTIGKDRSAKVTPSIFIVNEREIFSLKTQCEDVDEKWGKAVLQLAENFGNDKSLVMLNMCGKVSWTSIDKIKMAYKVLK